MGTRLIFLINSQLKLKLAEHVVIWDKLSSEPSGKGLTSPDKNVAEKVVFFFLKIKCPYTSKQVCLLPKTISSKYCNYSMFPVITRSRSYRLCVTVIEVPHDFFLITPGNFTLFWINPRKMHLLLLQYPWKFHIQPSHLPFFFWNSPIS